LAPQRIHDRRGGRRSGEQCRASPRRREDETGFTTMASDEQPLSGADASSQASIEGKLNGEAKGELEVEVNGESTTVPAGASVIDLLARLNMTGKRVAVAINRDVIPRSRHAEARLADGDTVEILEAVGGG
jgi:sulfur carrier protein